MPRLLLFFIVAWFAATTVAFHFNSGVMHRNVMRLYDVKTQLNGDMKNAMKNKEKEKLSEWKNKRQEEHVDGILYSTQVRDQINQII
jgi:hypothetical protein